MSENQIPIQLEAYYRQTFPNHQNVLVTDVVALTDGWESIIYVFNVVADSNSGDQPQSRILRIYPGTDAIYKSQREFEGMQILYQCGYPVPQVYHLGRTNSPFDGRPFMLMEYIEGEVLWPIISRSNPEHQKVLITQFCQLFVDLHNLDWQPLVSSEERRAIEQNANIFVDRWLAEVRGVMKQFPSLVAFGPVMDWLEARSNTVPCEWSAPVHWDFHPGNVILKPDGFAVVIDWTQVQVSDPRFDLGWTLLLTGIYEGDEFRNMILSEYERISGTPVQELAYFDVANCLKRLGTVMISLSAGADSMGMRPEAVENMRRDFPALQSVYDLLVKQSGIRVLAMEKLLGSG